MCGREYKVGPTCLFLALSFSVVTSQFAVEPWDTAVVVNSAVRLSCELQSLPLTETPIWYRYVGDPPVRDELWNGRQNRFFIAGNRNAGEYNLFINSTNVGDTGLYSCSYGTSSTPNATLTVLPTSWKPVCLKIPVNQYSKVGDAIDITCRSVGSLRTSLQWLRNEASMIPSDTTQNGTIVAIAHYEVIPSESFITFKCEASVPGLVEPYTCTLGPYPEEEPNSGAGSLIPFIIVGILSVIVILLFVVVLSIVFRHRRCRFCQTHMAEPQMVLDADAIAAGRGFPTIIPDDDDDDEDVTDGIDNAALSDNQPDIVTSITTRRNLTEKSPNSTLRDNMESSKRVALPTKKHAEIEKLKPSELRRIKKKRSPSASSHASRVENADVASSSGTGNRQDPDTSFPASVELNETPRSAASLSIDNQSDISQAGPSSEIAHSPINDLDASVGRKKRFSKRRDSKQSSKPSTPSTSPRNMTAPSNNSAMQSDTIIYAELDFSQNIGMNILGDEHL